MAGLYLLGIVVGILIALLYNGTLFKGEPVPFVMELQITAYQEPKKCNAIIMGKSKKISYSAHLL